MKPHYSNTNNPIDFPKSKNKMNERIEKLVRQADACYIPRYDMWQMDTETLEKFAELIVRECIDIVSPYAIRMENFDGGHPIADLKKHFGVEE